MVVGDQMGNWLKCFAASRWRHPGLWPYLRVRGAACCAAASYAASLFALLGMFVMIGGGNFLVIYMGLELLTLSSYALVALRRDTVVATEAAMKYFVLGALASCSTACR